MLGTHEPEHPEVTLEHILQYCFEIGPVANTGMGPSSITNTEILSWSTLTGIDLSPWEARTIRIMSAEFCNYLERSKSTDEPNPLKAEENRLLAKFNQARGKNG